MTLGLLKEPNYETRVSLLAEAVATLTKKGITVLVENGQLHVQCLAEAERLLPASVEP